MDAACPSSIPLLFTRLYGLLWLAPLAACLALGVRGYRSGGFPLHDLGRAGSVNAIFEKALGEPSLSPALEAELARLPPGRPLLILGPKSHPTAGLVAELIAYLAWPRPVTLVLEPMQLSLAALPPMRRDFAAVALCQMTPPPGFPSGKTFGTGLILVPLDK